MRSIYTHMNTQSNPPTVNDKPLSTQEARAVATWLEKRKGEKIPHGSVAIWKLRPSAISRLYHEKIWDILVAARRVEGEAAE